MDVLENFSPNKPYKFCLYLASVILVSTLLTEPVGININSVRSACFGLIIVGLIAWTADNRAIDYYYQLEQDEYHDIEKIIEDYSKVKLVINGGYLFMAFLIMGSNF